MGTDVKNTEPEKGQESKPDTPACCDGCVIWQKFGKNCHYYWGGKKHCTMFASDWDDAAMRQQ